MTSSEILEQLQTKVAAYKVAAEALRAYVEPLMGSQLPDDYTTAKENAQVHLMLAVDRAKAYNAEVKGENWTFKGKAPKLKFLGIFQHSAQAVLRPLCDYEENIQVWAEKSGRLKDSELSLLIENHRQARAGISEIARAISNHELQELAQAESARDEVARDGMTQAEVFALFEDGKAYSLFTIGAKTGKNTEKARSGLEFLCRERTERLFPIQTHGGRNYYSPADARKIAWKCYTAKARGTAGQKAK